MSPASASIRQRLLALGEPCAAQPAADWQGDIALPAELERFYREVGPLDCTLENRSSVRASGRRTSPTSSAGKLVATPPPPMTCA